MRTPRPSVIVAAMTEDDDRTGQGATAVEDHPAPSAVVSHPHPLAGPADRIRRFWIELMPWTLVGIGGALRLGQYLFRRSMWGDEDLIGLNIANRSFAKLLQPLTGNQAAPPGFLFVERGSMLAFGMNEYAFRVFALIAGVVSLVFVVRVARRVLSPGLVPVATALAALAPWLIFYSAELKPYSLDVLTTLVLIEATIALLSGPVTARRALVWGALAAVAFWFSYTALLVFAGLAVVAGAVVLWRRRLRATAWLAAAGLLAAASGAELYRVQLRAERQNTALTTYWARRQAFPPRHPVSREGLAWLANAWHLAVHNPFGFAEVALTTGLVIAGLVTLLRRRPLAAMLFVAPLPFLLAAAWRRSYPVQLRLLLFLVPLVLLIVAAAADWLRPSDRKAMSRRTAAIAAAATLVALVPIGIAAASPVRTSLDAVAHPFTRNELRPVFEFIRDHRRPGDAVWVHSGAGAPYDFYARIVGMRADYFMLAGSKGPGCTAALAEFGTSPRVWVVFGLHGSTAPPDEFEIFLTHLDTVGHRIGVLREPGATAWLYDTSSPADPSGHHVLRDPWIPCMKLGEAPWASLITGPFGTGKAV
jgi:Dolichyl-phosphate-mannose-protein mannosyltransferase